MAVEKEYNSYPDFYDLDLNHCIFSYIKFLKYILQNKIRTYSIMLKVYGIKNCNKVRDTFKWLDENDIEYEFINLKKEPLSEGKLDEFVHKVGLDVLINKRGTTYRNLGLKGKDLSEDDLFDVLLENQTMIKRPVLELDDAVLIGYDEDAFDSFV